MRLRGYDYSQKGAYFITICTEGRLPLFGSVGADSISALPAGSPHTTGEMQYCIVDSPPARMVDEIWRQTLEEYPGIHCPRSVVMPNHFHGILMVERADMESAPTISHVVQAFKRHTTIAYIKLVKAGQAPPFQKRVWQRSFYDHIIRSEAEYQRIWKYVNENPNKWAEDRYFPKGEIP